MFELNSFIQYFSFTERATECIYHLLLTTDGQMTLLSGYYASIDS